MGDHFADLGSSMLTLFSFVTLEGWIDDFRLIIKEGSVDGVMFVLFGIIFMLFANLVIFNVISATMVNVMMNEAGHDRIHAKEEDAKRFAKLFDKVDKDNDGTVSL